MVLLPRRDCQPRRGDQRLRPTRFAIAPRSQLRVLRYASLVSRYGQTRPAEHASHDAIEDVLALVRKQGGRATPARRLLLQALFESREHRSAEELASEIHARAPDVHLSTIYRNLEELERLGVVDSTRLGNGPATYHLASAAHGHLVCENCGSMTEVPDGMFAGLVRIADTDYGFAINPHRFAVMGRCARCR
jgi:Fur family transcriptional regulator, ferric uptake regulator